jgi:hypothetical protein
MICKSAPSGRALRVIISAHARAIASKREWPQIADLGVIDGNRDGNAGSQRQAGVATDSQTLLLDWGELAIRYA